ncbi:MAG: PfaD family polyunsaturated fatty acid/polyketide biosynthesis protein [Desulfobacteraceae bacterium]|jgi:trans-AT polyketide synthase/acyltransferase/oxidoreductase domain-containing protein|nr:PfaD family polyunsaturated fatty acid/polyketide biosynthesis protein [Desulfobacteraceae bacterium]
MQSQPLSSIGSLNPSTTYPAFSQKDLLSIIPLVRESIHVVQEISSGRIGLSLADQALVGQNLSASEMKNEGYRLRLMATLPALYPEWLGERSFLEVHAVRFPYITGAMFRGIASADMVIEIARAKMIGFFGAAGLSLIDIEKAINKIKTAIGESGLSWGSNLIHSPNEPDLEEKVVDLYLKEEVTRVSAAAFMTITPNVVRYACTGLYADNKGRIHRKNFIFAKLSRPEVARLFMLPAPKQILDLLVTQGKLTQTEAILASKIPVSEDITVEADSGGHTDNRPLTALFPTILSLRDEISTEKGYDRPIRIGAAGGLGTPASIAAAFAMGAAYVLTGSVNQSAVESGMSPEGRKLLAMAGVADVTMAPAADMFELGVKVQVLKRGTMFSNRAANLYSIYSQNSSIDTIPKDVKARLEKDVFHAPLEKIWTDTHTFFSKRDPEEIAKAEKNPKHLMALIFRWYLANSAMWAIKGDPVHKIDYQICCGPSMGAFNTWVKGSYLEKVENRTVSDIALNLLEGAAVITRAQQVRSYGVPVPGKAFNFTPRPLSYNIE